MRRPWKLLLCTHCLLSEIQYPATDTEFVASPRRIIGGAIPMISVSGNQVGQRSPKSVRSSPIVLESEVTTSIKQPARRRAKAKQNSLVIFTVGHSTRPLEEFEGLLLAHGVKQLVDIRTIPRSRHNPQFNGDSLPGSLKKAGIRYRHMPGLGGLRRARHDSINSGWHNASFRGFADYMQTPDFENALVELIRIAEACPTVIMCAEAVPWRCHRSLIADALLVRGIGVAEIARRVRTRPHTLTSWACVKRKRLTYPAPKATGSA
ncbi:MAG: DUF488 domain-containing protein [Terracidiphilus sp.]